MTTTAPAMSNSPGPESPALAAGALARSELGCAAVMLDALGDTVATIGVTVIVGAAVVTAGLGVVVAACVGSGVGGAVRSGVGSGVGRGVGCGVGGGVGCGVGGGVGCGVGGGVASACTTIVPLMLAPCTPQM